MKKVLKDLKILLLPIGLSTMLTYSSCDGGLFGCSSENLSCLYIHFRIYEESNSTRPLLTIASREYVLDSLKILNEENEEVEIDLGPDGLLGFWLENVNSNDTIYSRYYLYLLPQGSKKYDIDTLDFMYSYYIECTEEMRFIEGNYNRLEDVPSGICNPWFNFIKK